MASEVDDIMAFLRQHADQQFCGACCRTWSNVPLSFRDATLLVADHEPLSTTFETRDVAGTDV